MSLYLFAHPFSSYCMKVLIALWADDTPFAYRMLDDAHPEHMAELKQHWPFGQFPLLLDDGRPVVESTVIIEHLAAHYPGANQWIPGGEDGRRVRFLDRFFDTYVNEPDDRTGVQCASPRRIARPVRRGAGTHPAGDRL